MMCTRNNGTNMELDCCNVGWCDFQKGVTCQNIHGCTNHIPRLWKWLKRPLPSLIMLRDPLTRYVSAWHYRCHNPNYDCFGVRKEFAAIRYGRSRKKSFDEYLAMAEYQNIMTKMLALDKLPYGNYGELDHLHLKKAKERLLQVGEHLAGRARKEKGGEGRRGDESEA